MLEGARADPPATPLDGEAWRIAETASGAWAGQAGKIAVCQAGGWMFIAPRFGIRAFDKGSGCLMRYDNDWITVSRPASPAGGALVDAEARQAIAQIIAALTNAGIVPPA